MNRNTKIQKHLLNDQITMKDELILNHFVENEASFNDLRYIISYYNYLKKEDNRRNGDFLVYHGRQTVLLHLIKGQRYFGNTKLIECLPSEISGNKVFERTIIVNERHLFLKAMLFIEAGGDTFRLNDTEGFLQIHIPQRQTIKILESSEIINS